MTVNKFKYRLSLHLFSVSFSHKPFPHLISLGLRRYTEAECRLGVYPSLGPGHKTTRVDKCYCTKWNKYEHLVGS